MLIFNFFEQIFFCSCEIMLKISLLFPWNKDKYEKSANKKISEKEIIIITLLMNFWTAIIVVNSMVISCGLIKVFFPSLSNQALSILGMGTSILILLPLMSWWHKGKYQQSYIQYKNSVSTKKKSWKLITIFIIFFSMFLPFFIIIH